jgi:hypothetical protein
MSYKYVIRSGELERVKYSVERREPVIVEVMDEHMAWKKVKALLSRSPIEGGDKAAVLMDDASGIHEKGKWYVKILEEVE